MTAQHRHLQLHLFETRGEPATLRPEIRRRVLTLIAALLDEAAPGTRLTSDQATTTEAGHE